MGSVGLDDRGGVGLSARREPLRDHCLAQLRFCLASPRFLSVDFFAAAAVLSRDKFRRSRDSSVHAEVDARRRELRRGDCALLCQRRVRGRSHPQQQRRGQDAPAASWPCRVFFANLCPRRGAPGKPRRSARVVRGAERNRNPREHVSGSARRAGPGGGHSARRTSRGGLGSGGSRGQRDGTGLRHGAARSRRAPRGFSADGGWQHQFRNRVSRRRTTRSALPGPAGDDRCCGLLRSHGQ